MIDHQQIAAGEARISTEFLTAVQGLATQRLAVSDPQAAALGQHLRATTDQRGLHGTAAAIEVLARTPGSEAQEYTRRLVHYVDRQSQIEDLVAEATVPQDSVESAARNVIKLSEILYALSFVPTSLAPREQLATRIADALVKHRNPDGGWPYYIDSDSPSSHSVPSAYAIRALASHGYDVTAAVAYLTEQVRRPVSAQTDIFVQVLMIYVLCYLPDQYRHDRDLRKPFQDVWQRLSSLLSQDLEANIEYVTNRLNYVRIPWQLYLIASSARLFPYRRFTSAKAQRRLRAILTSITTAGGLLYPHSGRDLSSRTNAILFDVLKQIDTELNARKLPLKPFAYIDIITSAIASRAFQYVVRVIVLALIVYAVTRWVRSGQTSVSALAPELVSSVLLILLTGKREG